MRTRKKLITAPHTPQEYSAAAHTAYLMRDDGCGKRDIIKYTGIPDAHVRKIMTTEAGKAQVAGLLESMGKIPDLEKIKSIQTGKMGPVKFAKCLRTGRVRLGVTQEQLDEIVREHAQKTLQNRK